MDLLTLAASAARASVPEIAKQLWDEGGGKLLQATASASAALYGSVLSSFGIEVVRILLAPEDRLTEVSLNLRKLVREPFDTAVLLLAALESIDVVDPEAFRHLEGRYRDALRHLDSAYTLADGEERSLITLLRAGVCLRLPGGCSEAAVHLEEFSDACEQRAKSILATIPPLRDQARDWRQKAESIETSASGMFAGGGLAMWEEALRWHEKGSLIRRARINTLLADETDRMAIELRKAAHMCRQLALLAKSA